MNRKEFIRRSVQLGILAGMAAGVGYLITKEKIDYKCMIDEKCNSCKKFTTCELDKAIASRKNER